MIFLRCLIVCLSRFDLVIESPKMFSFTLHFKILQGV